MAAGRHRGGGRLAAEQEPSQPLQEAAPGASAALSCLWPPSSAAFAPLGGPSLGIVLPFLSLPPLCPSWGPRPQLTLGHVHTPHPSSPLLGRPPGSLPGLAWHMPGRREGGGRDVATATREGGGRGRGRWYEWVRAARPSSCAAPRWPEATLRPHGRSARELWSVCRGSCWGLGWGGSACSSARPGSGWFGWNHGGVS